MSDRAPPEIQYPDLILKESLGSGGMATVYAATHPEWGDVAVKVLHEDARPRHRRRFVEEIKVLSAFRHPGVVRVLAAGQTGDRVWIVMERVHGPSWFARIKQGGAQRIPTAAKIATAVLEGLGALHDAGIVHRDIKPQNVLLGPGGVVKLCDFGIARTDDVDRLELTATGDRLGTLSYMAPEQRLNAKRAGPAADLYSVGACLFVASTARKCPDLSLSEFRPELLDAVPEPLRTVVGAATRYDPNARYRDAGEMRAALEPLLTASR